MKFLNLVEYLEQMEQETGRIKLEKICTDVLKEADSEDITKLVYLLQGELGPSHLGIEIGMSEKLLLQAINDDNNDDMKNLLKTSGDLGVVALKKFNSGEKNNLSVSDVHEEIIKIAKISGSGSQAKKQESIKLLLESLGGKEAKWAIRIILGKMRTNVSDSTIAKAIGTAFGTEKTSIKAAERAFLVSSDLGKVAQIAIDEGDDGLNSIKADPHSPIKPMLAGRARSIEEAVKKTKGVMYVESKLDGERVQIHIRNGDVKIFSRSGEIITLHYLDVAKHLSTLEHNVIIEGEAIAMSANGEMLPFQELMHRKRLHDQENTIKKYPVTINLFDILYSDGVDMLDMPFTERKQVLNSIIQEDDIVKFITPNIAKNGDELKTMLDEALADGAEGLMIKDGKGTYAAGSRGNQWLKLKREYMTGGETFDLVVVGALNGRGKRAGKCGALVVAIRNGDKLSVLGKVGTGFKDDDIDMFTEEFSKLQIDSKPDNVDCNITVDTWFEPKTVLEISTFEVTKSPTAPGGYGMRFPVYVRQRPDRNVGNASTLDDLIELYNSQVKQS